MVFLFIPNIIGYFRFLALFAILFTFSYSPFLTVTFYGLSQLLDAFDGMAARHFKQSTKFGAVLDMVCDRASDAVILAILGSLYPSWAWIFYSDIILDLVSHWYQMYAGLLTGEHHKETKTTWKILEWYYKKPVLFTLVAGNELFFMSAYLHAFSKNWPSLAVSVNLGLVCVGFALFLVKKVTSVVGLLSACEKVAEYDTRERAKRAE